MNVTVYPFTITLPSDPNRPNRVHTIERELPFCQWCLADRDRTITTMVFDEIERCKTGWGTRTEPATIEQGTMLTKRLAEFPHGFECSSCHRHFSQSVETMQSLSIGFDGYPPIADVLRALADVVAQARASLSASQYRDLEFDYDSEGCRLWVTLKYRRSE